MCQSQLNTSCSYHIDMPRQFADQSVCLLPMTVPCTLHCPPPLSFSLSLSLCLFRLLLLSVFVILETIFVEFRSFIWVMDSHLRLISHAPVPAAPLKCSPPMSNSTGFSTFTCNCSTSSSSSSSETRLSGASPDKELSSVWFRLSILDLLRPIYVLLLPPPSLLLSICISFFTSFSSAKQLLSYVC